MKYNPVLLSKLAQEFELSDPIDWGLLLIDETDIYDNLAESAADILNNSDTPELTAAVAMTKLLVENFVLNLQLYGLENYGDY